MSKIIAVTSGKGGVGKSTVAAGIGEAIAKRGKTVVIVELDTGLRGMDIMLGVENQAVYDLGDLLSGLCALEDALVPIEAFPGLTLIVASTAVPNQTDADQTAALFQALYDRFDYILLDMPAGVSVSLSLIPSLADAALMVTTPDYVSVRDSNKMVSVLAEQGFLNCKLLINKVNTKYRRMNMIRDLDEVLDGVGIPLIGVLPEDLQIKSAFSYGEPLEEGSAPEIIFDRIAARIEGEYTPLYIE